MIKKSNKKKNYRTNKRSSRQNKYNTKNENTNNNRFYQKNKKNSDKSEKMKFSKKHPRIALIIKILLLLFVAFIVVGAGIICGMIYGGWGDDFEITKEELVIGSSNSIILDKDGNKLAELSGDDNRKIIKLEQVPQNLKNAYISIEDERFYKHNGIDIKRTGGAIFKYAIKAGNANFGGSTITQQLVKNITQDKEKSGLAGIMRKVKEWAKAYQIERMISKDQILELYLNIIFVGGNKSNLGVEVGSEYYFNKSVSELNLAECAYLAGINHSPNKYNPYDTKKDNTEAIKKRTKTVLYKMKDLGYINQTEYDEAVAQVEEGLKFEQSNSLGTMYSYHTDATIAQVIEDIAKEKEISKSLATTYVYSSGLTIYSTQDTELQAKMNEVMVDDSDKYIKSSKLNEGATTQAAMVVIDNETGYVAGVVGGLGEKTESRGLNRATQSPRQTGSSIKPLTSLIPGINEGVITAATVYDDTLAEFLNGTYKPKDYNTPKGLISIRSAVKTSQNIPFVKVVSELTPEKSIEYLEKMGVSTIDHERDGLAALSIGGFTNGISPLEMAGCYATIENDGEYRRPMFYSKVTDQNGNTVLEGKQNKEQVISPQAAYVIKNVLQSVVQSGGTATYCAINGMDVAAKTGTTNSDYDRWLCGFTNYYTGVCWYGYDQNEEVVASSNPAGKIWEAIMKKLHSGLDSSRFEKPDGVVSATICRASGKRATSKCSDTYTEYFVEGLVPGECDGHANSAEICEDTGLLANEHCPNKVTKYYSYLVEKERLGLWHNYSSSSSSAPKTYCTEHKQQNEEAKPKKEEPTITLKGEASITLNVGDTYTEQGATAKDDTDGDISSKITISGSVNTSKAGKYTISYSVKNSKGKTSTAKRTINVKAKETPKPENKTEEKENTTPEATNTTSDKSKEKETKPTTTEPVEKEKTEQ